MKCERCSKTTLTVTRKEKALVTNHYTGKQYEVTIIHIECENCGYEFKEEI